MFKEIKQAIIERQKTRECQILGEIEEVYYNTMVDVIKQDKNISDCILQLKQISKEDKDIIQRSIKENFDKKLIKFDDDMCCKNLGLKWNALAIMISGIGFGMNMVPMILTGIGIMEVTSLRALAYFMDLNKDGQRSAVYKKYQNMTADSETMVNLTRCCIDRYIREQDNQNDLVLAK